MKIFYSHATTDDQKKKTGSKTIQDHTFGVFDKAIARLYEEIKFSLPLDILKKLIKDICLLHDLGKYTDYFQDYLLTNNFDQQLKSHARFGANVIYNSYSTDQYLAYLGYYLVLNHHRNLHYPFKGDRMMDKRDRKLLNEEFDKKKATLISNIEQIEQELTLPVKTHLNFPNAKSLIRYLEEWTEKEMKIENYFLICYLFSLLIEADKIDASNTRLHDFKPIAKDSVDRFLGPPPLDISLQNKLRNEVRKKVCDHLSDSNILDYRLFTLAAPTGIGKTFTALSFALGLRDQLPNQPQIITALPFINIIEQTISEYEKVLRDQDVVIKGHFQFADIAKESKKGDGEKDSEDNYSQKRMSLRTWQADIIVTSFVQLLQTMIANKNKWLLKFNHFAGSIIIMDEVQNIKLEQVPLIGATIYFMSKFLNTRFILMTATKPLIFELADSVILTERGLSASQKVKNLLPNSAEIYKQFHRTKIVPLIGEEIMTTEIFVEEVKKRIIGKSCIIVCNKVARSIELFKALQGQQEDLGLKEDDFYYLSTNILPVERLEIINRIKEDITNGKKPILVATQVVEAGVDLDFNLGFRDLGPIDSIVQVAGRINRNDLWGKYAPLYIVDFGECKDIYGSITAIQAKNALGSNEILEPAYFNLVEEYFKDVSGKKNYQFSKKLFKGMEYLCFDCEKETEDIIPIKNFRVIDGQQYAVTVFIELNEDAKEAKAAFLRQYTYKSRKEKYALKEAFEKNYKKSFFQHTITVPNFYTEDLPLIDETKPDMLIKYVAFENVKNYYFDKTGFKREKKTETNKEHTCQY